MKYINDFHGPCTIRVMEDCISIKKSNGKEIGSWQYIFIREFRFDDEKSQFMFKSGRRGPFGVTDYLFKLHNRTYYDLRETVNRIAEGRSGSNPSKAESYKPPVPPHASRSSTPTRNHNGSDYTYDDLPTVRSIGHHRSASNPDLSSDPVFGHLLRKEHGSTRSSPSKPSSPQSSCKNAATQDQSTDYQVPKPATDNIYSIPRPQSDPRNDYQIPIPLEDTYMVPRPHNMKAHTHSDSSLLLRRTGIMSEKIIERSFEHSYEDPDNVGGIRKL